MEEGAGVIMRRKKSSRTGRAGDLAAIRETTDEQRTSPAFGWIRCQTSVVPKSIFRFISGQNHLIRKLHGNFKRRRFRNTDDGDSDDNVGKERRIEKPICIYRRVRDNISLKNQRILDSIVRKSAIKPTDTVLEIRPGTRNLTLKLLEVSSRVIVVEIDGRMVEILLKRASECGFKDRLSNPYQSSTLLLQKEFAKRLLAKPGDSEFNRLAVNVQLVADVEHVTDVSKREFLPCPKVDSSVVIIRPKAHFPDVNLDEWGAFTRTCFGKKNKTLGATFKQKKKVMELLRLSEMVALNGENTFDLRGYDSTNLKEVEEGGDGDGEEECFSSSGCKTRVSLFWEKVIRVLKAGGFEDKRPLKLLHEELLSLLALFNQAGICLHDRSNSGAIGERERRREKEAQRGERERREMRRADRRERNLGRKDAPARFGYGRQLRTQREEREEEEATDRERNEFEERE
ncbi:putative dimethyladenosine transferase [Morus notabilis]|uniref:rRNA adenine N(6)-methyltransferase n=1 Tax=Morus notabilis TaxID=981085 RepID=W9R981_9ROSA|nr:putative dimethyladenosine transferase [Morus notabilis]